MSTNPIHDALNRFILDPDPLVGGGNLGGLYFRNMNRDRSVRIIASRPYPVMDNENLEINNKTIENLDPHSVGFCLSPRPALVISCDDATSDFAVELKGGKKYKLVVDGQTISTNASLTDFAQLLQPYAVETSFLRLPQSFICSEYNDLNVINIPYMNDGGEEPIVIKFLQDTARAIPTVLEFTTASTLVNVPGYGAMLLNTYTPTDKPNMRVLSIDLSQFVDNHFKIECSSPSENIQFMDLTDVFNTTQDTTFNRAIVTYPTLHDGAAYWCANIVVRGDNHVN